MPLYRRLLMPGCFLDKVLPLDKTKPKSWSFCNWASAPESQTLTADVYGKVKDLFAGCQAKAWETILRSTPIRSWVRGFLKGKSQEAGINHHPVTTLWHFFIVVLEARISPVYDSLARWFMAWGSVSSSCPGGTTWVCMVVVLPTTILAIWLWLISI